MEKYPGTVTRIQEDYDDDDDDDDHDDDDDDDDDDDGCQDCDDDRRNSCDSAGHKQKNLPTQGATCRKLANSFYQLLPRLANSPAKDSVGPPSPPTARTKGAPAKLGPVALTVATPNKTNANKKLGSKQT